MNKKKCLIKKILAFSIIMIFLGLAVQPGTANVETDKKDEFDKNFLFQTIVDIANNKEFKNLIDKEKKNGLFLDVHYNIKNIFRKILLKEPNLLSSLFFTRSDLTHGNLDLAYETGCELINIVGEDKALEIIDSITITNPTISKKLSDIIYSNEKIKNKIAEIKLMNRELNPTLPFEGYPLICAVLLMLTFTFAIPMVSIFVIILTLSTHPVLGPLLVGFLGLFSANLALFLTLIKIFC